MEVSIHFKGILSFIGPLAKTKNPSTKKSDFSAKFRA